MKEITEHNSSEGKQDAEPDEKATYQTPACESYEPLEIMSAWQDRSSELVF